MAESKWKLIKALTGARKRKKGEKYMDEDKMKKIRESFKGVTDEDEYLDELEKKAKSKWLIGPPLQL